MLGDLLIRQGYPPKLHLGNGVGTCRRHRRTAHVRSNSTKNSSDERLESALAALDAFFPTPTPPPAEVSSDRSTESASKVAEILTEATERSGGVASTSASTSTGDAAEEPSINLQNWREFDKKALLSLAWSKGRSWLKDQVKPTSIIGEDDYLPRVQPRFAYIILAANLIVYAIGLARLTEGPEGPMNYFLQFAEVNEAVEAGEYYRIVTANFLHDSFVHLCVSSYALLTIAPEAEAVLGSFAFLTTYLLGGIAGTGLCFLFTDTLTVGASSGIFGLIGAMGAFLYKNHKTPKTSEGLLFAVGLLAFNLFLANDHATTVDNLGHFGAMVCGIYLGILLSPAVVETPSTPDPSGSIPDKQSASQNLQNISSASGVLRGGVQAPDPEAQRGAAQNDAAQNVKVVKPNGLQSVIVSACVTLTLASSIAITVLHRTGELPYPKWF